MVASSAAGMAAESVAETVENWADGWVAWMADKSVAHSAGNSAG